MVSKILLLAVGLLSLLSRSRGQATLQIEGAGETKRILESMGIIEVCVTISNAVPGDSATFNILANSGVENPALYFELPSTIRTLNSTLTRTCVDIVIVQNGIETGNGDTTFIVSLANREVSGTVTIDSVNQATTLTIEIQDTDVVEVGFERALYQVMEGGGTVRICVDLVNGQILTGLDLEVRLGFSPALATGLSSGSTNFILSNSSRQSCLNFTTGSPNALIEDNMFQTATLMQGDIQVQFSRSASTVEIIEASVATLEIAGMTARDVVEGAFNTTATVTICLNLISVEGGLRRDIIVNVTTRNGTATVANNDYAAVMMTLTIPSGTTLDSFNSSNYCVDVLIIGDNVRELNETFLVNFDASPDVFRGPDNVTITILDDGDVNECTMLLSPINGNVELNGTSLGSVAQYTCESNFGIVPESSRIRTCGMDNWDGVDPRCAAICDQLSLQNGVVLTPTDISFIVEGIMARHTCNEDYTLEGNSIRTCQSSGMWSGSAPVCNPITCPMLRSPANGGVTHGGMSVGAVATYSCFTGFSLEGGGTGGARRVCLSDGTWTGAEPTCNGAVRIIPSGAILMLALVSLLSIVLQTCI